MDSARHTKNEKVNQLETGILWDSKIRNWYNFVLETRYDTEVGWSPYIYLETPKLLVEG